MNQETQVIILPYTDIVERTADDHVGMAHKRPGTMWGKVKDTFHKVFSVGELMSYGEFCDRYESLLIAVGFDENYARRMTQPGHINSGPVHCGWVFIH
jgi:hypothetical protein